MPKAKSKSLIVKIQDPDFLHLPFLLKKFTYFMDIFGH